jgi:ABC-type multidrug transport system permease subunit
MKLMIFVGITIFGSLGAWLGSMMDGGNMFGLWGILISSLGSLFGIWAGYKAAQNLGI